MVLFLEDIRDRNSPGDHRILCIWEHHPLPGFYVGSTKETVFTELVDTIAAVHPELNRNAMLAVIQDRENKMNTSIASGVAVPHGYYPEAGGIVGAIGISKTGIEYNALDHKPVNLVFLKEKINPLIGSAGPHGRPHFHLYQSRISPEIEMVTACHGNILPEFCRAFFTACSIPPQQGTSILITVTDFMLFCLIISVSFSL